MVFAFFLLFRCKPIAFWCLYWNSENVLKNTDALKYTESGLKISKQTIHTIINKL